LMWFCHCCTAKNEKNLVKCRVCGRDESYVLQGRPLPFHGKSSQVYRSSHVLTALESVHEVDSEHMTALHSACVLGNYPVVKELLRLKSRVDVLTSKGHTALHLAVYGGSFECVKELLMHQSTVNVATKCECSTPLHIACERGFGRIAELLLQSGANVNACNILQRTPLHCAAATGRTDIGQLLLNNGADSDALDAHGWSARQVAELFSHRDFQELMVRDKLVEKQSVFKELPAAKWHWYVCY